jgi:hypothetical protein
MKLFFLKLKDKFWWNYLFLFTVLIIYFITGLFDFSYFLSVWKDVYNIFVKQILIVLFIVFIFMFVLNILLQKEKIKNLIKNSSTTTKYIFSLLGWIFSTGPVYMWYPFLKKLKDHWLHSGHIATFIYARAVKIPFLAAMIFYFGLKYTVIFNLVLIFLALIIWIIINLLVWKAYK